MSPRLRLSAEGRLVLACGVSALLSGALFSLPVLTAIGALALAVTVIAWSSTDEMVGRLGQERAWLRARSQRRLVQGQASEIELSLEAPGAWSGLRIWAQLVVSEGLLVTPEAELVQLGAGAPALRVALRSDYIGAAAIYGAKVQGRGLFGLSIWSLRIRAAAAFEVRPRPLEPQIRGQLRVGSGLSSPISRLLRPKRGGLEEHDLRHWQPGDTPRDIHWPVSLRSGALWVRRRAGEEAAALWLVLDMSSLESGGLAPAARSLVAELAAALYELAAVQRREVGVVVYRGGQLTTLASGYSRGHREQLLGLIASAASPGAAAVTVNDAPALRQLVEHDVWLWDQRLFSDDSAVDADAALAGWLLSLERRDAGDAASRADRGSLDGRGASSAGERVDSLEQLLARYVRRWGLSLPLSARRPGARSRALGRQIDAVYRLARSRADVVWIGELPPYVPSGLPRGVERWTWCILPPKPASFAADTPAARAAAALLRDDSLRAHRAKADQLSSRRAGVFCLDAEQDVEQAALRLLPYGAPTRRASSANRA